VASGLTDDVPLKVVNTTAGTVLDGCIVLDVKEGERVTMEVDLSIDYSGPLLMRLMKEGARENS
jgi:ligand-binding sensor protein